MRSKSAILLVGDSRTKLDIWLLIALILPPVAAALGYPRSVPDLSQHSSSNALASSFDNLTSYLGADMNLHYTNGNNGQRRHPSLARDAVPLTNPGSVALHRELRAPGTPKTRKCTYTYSSDFAYFVRVFGVFHRKLWV